MAVPNTFATSTSPIPLANLDANFAYYDAGFSLSGSAVTFAGSITLTTGTANGVSYLNASKVLTTGSAFTFSGTNAVINVTDNTNAALRITQLGTGNALLVEDIANPDASPFLIDSGGVVVKGATQAYASTTGNTPVVQLHGSTTSTQNVGYAATNWATAAGGSSFTLAKSRGGVIGTHAITADGDNLGIIYFLGSDGTTFIPAAQITGSVDGTPGTSDMPGSLRFSTTADGASNVTERMRIDSNGDVGIGTTNPQVKLEVAGSNNSTWSATLTSISGTTMTIAGTVTGTIAIGDIVYGGSVQPYTRITAGSALSWTVSVFQTVASATLVGGATYGNTLIRITDTDINEGAGQPTGALQFFTSDASAPTAGVGAYVAALAESTTPDTSLVFGTRDNAGGGIDANERVRITSAGDVGIGTNAPGAKLDVSSSTANIIVSRSTGGYAAFQRFSPTGQQAYDFYTINSVEVARITGDPSFLSFSTGSSATERMRINSSGAVTIGNTVDNNTRVLTFNTVSGGSSSIQSITDGATNQALTFSTTFSTLQERMRIDGNGNVLVTSAAGLGYGTGSGGTVTQATSRTTGVTLSKPTGAITMFSAAGSVVAATFTVTNTLVAATDTINLNQKSGTNLYVLLVTAVAAGSFNITFYTTGGVATDAPVINFAIIKGVTA